MSKTASLNETTESDSAFSMTQYFFAHENNSENLYAKMLQHMNNSKNPKHENLVTLSFCPRVLKNKSLVFLNV